MERVQGSDAIVRVPQRRHSRTKLIDLSLPLKAGHCDAGAVRIDYTNHKKGGNILGLMGRLPHYKITLRNLLSAAAHFLGIRAVTSKDFPDGYGLAWETIHASTHAGTHMDAPWHYGPYCNGLAARRIDQVPLDWCWGDGVVIDLRRLLRAKEISLDDVKDALREMKHDVREGEIVLFMTGADAFWGTEEYLWVCPAIGADVIRWMIARGVRVMGTDAFGFDRSFQEMYKDYLRTGENKHLWPSHIAGRDNEYCQIEKLHNLDAIPSRTGFKVAAFPIAVEGGSAGWVRAVAIVQEPFSGGNNGDQ